MADIREIVRLVRRADREARRILATHESSASRVITIEETYSRVGKLSVQQDDLLRQALRGIENGLYRSAIVMSWAAFMDFTEQKLASDGFVAVNARYSAWKIIDIEDMRDRITDYQIIEALHGVRLCSKGEKKSLHGMLSMRNECAHPSSFLPDLNGALGFISQVLHRIELLKTKPGP